MPDLYQTKGKTPEYGTYLATNSTGRIVLEMKGTGEVKDFAPNDVEVVRPYTVKIGEVQYAAVPGSLKQGDWVLAGSAMLKVNAIDTKAINPASLPADARLLVTETLPRPEPIK